MKNSGFAIVKVSEYKGENAKPDTNGNSPMYLHPISGNIPNRNVLAGTVAIAQGFEEGNSYLAQWSVGTPDPTYGVQVNWTAVTGEPLSAIDLIQAVSSTLFNNEAGTMFEVATGKTTEVAEVQTSKASSKKADAQAG